MEGGPPGSEVCKYKVYFGKRRPLLHMHNGFVHLIAEIDFLWKHFSQFGFSLKIFFIKKISLLESGWSIIIIKEKNNHLKILKCNDIP